MQNTLRRIILSAIVGLLAIGGSSDRTHAQSYPIDCAILLCLSGGWPASVPCSRARAEFIRRITPWPVEPPLQIWRCPMAAAYEPTITGNDRLYDIRSDAALGSAAQSSMTSQTEPQDASTRMVLRDGAPTTKSLPDEFALQSVQDRADIDISGPEFNFVRSIRVWHVRSAYQREDYEDDREYCRRSYRVEMGSYGVQGEFGWRDASPYALPESYSGLEGWGEDCPGLWHRSVFVEWRDYTGNYGFEQVEY